jgi:hypothetical protein
LLIVNKPLKLDSCKSWDQILLLTMKMLQKLLKNQMIQSLEVLKNHSILSNLLMFSKNQFYLEAIKLKQLMIIQIEIHEIGLSNAKVLTEKTLKLMP